jgi:hypothetical protein
MRCMSSTKVMGLGGKWRGAIASAAVPGLLLFLAGCHKSEDANADAGATVAAVEAEAGSGDVAPPPPVVSGDPDIPVNEAIVGTNPVPADYAAETAPPAAIEEEKPPSPETGDVWAPGYWWWSTPFHRYVWVGGAWRNPPPQQSWTPGVWTQAGPTRWVWMPGFWGTPGIARPAFAEIAPPPPREESWGVPPSPGMVWSHGYYAWRDGSYVWLPGAWERPPGVGYEWVRPSYSFVGGRYFLSPGRWDHPIARRGVAYMPDVNVRPGGRYTPVAVPATIVQAHSTYVTNANHSAWMGGVRQANGGYTFSNHPQPRTGTPPVAGGPGPAEHPGAGNEPTRGLAPGAATLAGGTPGNTPGATGPGAHPLTPENHPMPTVGGGTPGSHPGPGEGHGGGHGGSSSGGHGGGGSGHHP